MHDLIDQLFSAYLKTCTLVYCVIILFASFMYDLYQGGKRTGESVGCLLFLFPFIFFFLGGIPILILVIVTEMIALAFSAGIDGKNAIMTVITFLFVYGILKKRMFWSDSDK